MTMYIPAMRIVTERNETIYKTAGYVGVESYSTFQDALNKAVTDAQYERASGLRAVGKSSISHKSVEPVVLKETKMVEAE